MLGATGEQSRQKWKINRYNKWGKLQLCALCLYTLLSFTRAQMHASHEECISLLGGYNVTILMVADPGDASGTAEAKYYIENLENPTFVPKGDTMCVNRAYGTIMGQKVSIVSSGINAQASAICTMEILQCTDHIQDFIFSGTSGFSPAVGGILDPSDCSKPAQAPSITRIGDVCVTPFSNNWECRLASWSQQCGGSSNQCMEPMMTDNLTVSSLYGECSFDIYSEASVELADELISANQRFASHNSLSRNSEVQSYEQSYWAAMSNGTGSNYATSYNGLSGPTIYNYTQCAETDGQFFWSGAPWDYNARQYVAYTLGEALDLDLKPSDVLAVSAMEAVGVSLAMQRYAATNGGMEIPFTHVRGSSDYVHLPLQSSGNSSNIWSEITTVPQVDFINGYSWAIASYSSVVLDLFLARCVDVNNGDQSACQMKSGGVTYANS